MEIFHFQNGGCLPSWILKISKFYWPVGEQEGWYASQCQISSESVKQF